MISDGASRLNRHLQIAYIHALKYPSYEVNGLQAIKMAAAFSQLVNTTFFVKELTTSVAKLKQQYDLNKSALNIRSMLLNYLPDRVVLRIINLFERSVLTYLQWHPRWSRFDGQKILFVRSPGELLFWGAQKSSNFLFRDWFFIFEGHSKIGLSLDPPKDDVENKYQQAVMEALTQYNLVICLTQALADDISCLTHKAVNPMVIRHASPLSRKPTVPQVQFGDRVVIGYIGQISHFKGVDILLEAMRFVPSNCTLRLVGRIRHEEDMDPDWIHKYLEDPCLKHRIELRNPVPINYVSDEIDRCDIVVQPASQHILNTQYEAPLKSFDYMVRGKPILVADVPCHRELFIDGVNGLFYMANPKNLAEQIMNLINNPALATKIARGAWEQAIDYDYQLRAKRILSLIDVKHG